MFGRGKNKNKERGEEPRFFEELRDTRIDFPRSKGKFRNLFPNMVPKPKDPDAQIRRNEGGES